MAISLPSCTAMNFATRLAHWLETRWVAPAYSGWLLSGAAAFFFLAASNTLAGWLYVISGMIVALNAIAAWLATRNLQGLTIARLPIHPVSVGDELIVEIQLTNSTATPKTLLQVYEQPAFRERVDGGREIMYFHDAHTVETITPKSTYALVYRRLMTGRGIFHWSAVQVRTAAPLGLFWCQRRWPVPSAVIIYPKVLPLSQSPLVDEMGRSTSLMMRSDRRSQAANEGQTKSIRPYRWGDPTRLIHWRTSARHGELRVRELELLTGGQDLVIGLDSSATWSYDQFESAVVAAASLYIYALRQQLNVALWTPTTGMIQGEQRVLEALADIYPSKTFNTGENAVRDRLPASPMVWLTANVTSLATLPVGSRWVLWPSPGLSPAAPSTFLPGLAILDLSLSQESSPRGWQYLQSQLQRPLTRP